MKVEESLNVTFDETPPPPKTSPLEDDELVKEEAIEVHNAEDTLEIAEITRKKMNAKMTDPECVTHKVAQCAIDRKHDAIDLKNLLIANDNLIVECLSKEVFSVVTKSELNVARFAKMHVANTSVEARCLALEAELATLRDKSHQDNQGELIKHFSKLEVDHLNIQLKYQNLKDNIGNNPPTPDKDTPDFDSVFVIGKMRASLQGKDNAIRKLKKQLSQLQVTCSDTDRTLRVQTTDSQITKLTDHVTKLTTENVNLKTCVGKATINPQVSTRDKHAIDVEPIVPRLRNNRDAHLDYLRHLKESVETIRDIVEEAKVLANTPLIRKKQVTIAKPSDRKDSNKQPKSNPKTNRISPAKGANKLPVEDLPRTNKSHLRTTNRVDSSSRLKVYYVEGLGHNLFSVEQFCDSDLEVAFRKHSYYVRDADGVDLIKGSRGSNLYTILVEDMMKSSPICFLSKASKNKSWLWKKYILVIMDDYSQFTWVKFLRSKDETPDVVIKFITQIQVGLNKTVRYVRTDNGTEFVNHTMTEYYERIGIFHQKTVPKTPQQNSVVERQNRTLVEAARTMLIFSKALMFLWAEAMATAEDLGKLQPTADTGIFVGYAPSRKGYRITQRIMETIHVQFDELTEPMAPVHLSTGPASNFLTTGQIISGLIPNPVPATPYAPPTNKELEILFQPMFDEYLEPPLAERPGSPAQAVQALVTSADTPLSTTIDQDAPSPHISTSYLALQSYSLPLSIVAEPHFMEHHNVAPVDNNPFVNVFAPEPHSKALSSGDISSTESPYEGIVISQSHKRRNGRIDAENC
nr:hypothetical protein [Tanacetum cinerariifolium]